MEVGKISLTQFVPETRSDKMEQRIAELEAALFQIAMIGYADPDCNLCGEYIEARSIANSVLAKEWK